MTEKEYFERLIEIHGQDKFGLYTASYQDDDGDQKAEIKCWGCDAIGHSLWSEGWRVHFNHGEDCQYIQLINRINHER